jgi:hypothetical protein
MLDKKKGGRPTISKTGERSLLLGVRLSKSDMAALNKCAVALNLTLSEVVRKALKPIVTKYKP